MEKYKSIYPTLRQAKTKWSKPSIVAKQGEGPSHDWYDMLKKDARAKLASSIHTSKLGSMSHQTKIVREGIGDFITSKTGDMVKKHLDKVYPAGKLGRDNEAAAKFRAHDQSFMKTYEKGGMVGVALRIRKERKNMSEEAGGEDHIYHVTHTKHVAKIQKQGLRPMQTSNWVKGKKDGERYGGGEVYAFTHKADAQRWAGNMDWHHNQTLGSGKISIVTARRPKDRKFEVDENDPLSQSGSKGPWIKTHGSIEPHHIVSVEKYMGPKKLGEAKDRIGKPTASAEEIAKKHNLSVDQINAQIKKGIAVEKEHTNDEAEAHEIARDHLDEFPDYYDRLATMEKAAKKAVKEGYDQEKELLRNRIETHKGLEQKYAKKNGEESREAAFHRALVKRMQKELGEDTENVNENVVNAVGGGMSPVVGGEGNIHGVDPIMSKPIRRRKFAGKQVFVVDPTTYHKAYLGKRKYEHYEKYLEGCDIAEEIRAYGRKYWDEPIIIENEQTGAMVYLKYGSR